MEPLPPPMVVAVVATVSWAIVTMVLGLPLVKAWVKRIEQKGAAQLPADANARLSRIESAIDTIAIEVERISESQRFLTKLQSEKRIASEERAADLDH